MVATTGDYVPLACGDYDVLELVCTYRHEIELTLDGGEAFVGTAETLETDGRAEYLVVTPGDGVSRRVRIDRLRTLSVLTRPSRLGTFEFGANLAGGPPPPRATPGSAARTPDRSSPE